MTNPSAAQKRKKRREQKLLEEEKARRAPVSTPIPLPTSTAPIPASSTTANDAEPIHVVHNAPARRPFPAGHPAANWPAHLQSFIYDPISRSPSPPPTSYNIVPDIRAIHPIPASPASPTHDRSWYDEAPDLPSVLTVHTTDSVPPARDFTALRSESSHPWRTIRRRNRRLLPERRPFPRSFLKRLHARDTTPPTPSTPIHAVVPPPPPPLEPQLHGRSLRPADLLGLIPLHPDNPIHPDDVPPSDLPAPSLCLFPADHPPSKFPVETEYGPVVHELALACSRALPTALDIGGDLCNIVWPPVVYPDGNVDPNPEARLDLIARLPPDHLVFLCAITHMGRLEHHFALLFDSAVVEFARAWVHHCELLGEAG